mgnify:CR=1 FL=1
MVAAALPMKRELKDGEAGNEGEEGMMVAAALPMKRELKDAITAFLSTTSTGCSGTPYEEGTESSARYDLHIDIQTLQRHSL